MKLTVIPITIDVLKTTHKYLRDLESWKSEDQKRPSKLQPDIGLNTGKSPGDLWRLVVAKILEKEYQLMLMEKHAKHNISQGIQRTREIK